MKAICQRGGRFAFCPPPRVALLLAAAVLWGAGLHASEDPPEPPLALKKIENVAFSDDLFPFLMKEGTLLSNYEGVISANGKLKKGAYYYNRGEDNRLNGIYQCISNLSNSGKDVSVMRSIWTRKFEEGGSLSRKFAVNLGVNYTTRWLSNDYYYDYYYYGAMPGAEVSVSFPTLMSRFSLGVVVSTYYAYFTQNYLIGPSLEYDFSFDNAFGGAVTNLHALASLSPLLVLEGDDLTWAMSLNAAIRWWALPYMAVNAGYSYFVLFNTDTTQKNVVSYDTHGFKVGLVWAL